MYKRQIDSIDSIKPLEIYGSSKNGAYFSLDSFLCASKPFNGLYIYNNKIIVSNIFERIILKGKEYTLKNYNTISNNFSNKENILQIDLDALEYQYRCQNVTYTKKIYFLKDTNNLVIEYDINNENEEKVRFGIIPMLTYRDAIHMKKANFLKFGSRLVDDGVLVNLSISDNQNVVIKCRDSRYIEGNSYVNNIRHEVLNLDMKKDTFIEDLFLPGEFEILLKPNETKNVKVCISNNDIDISGDIFKHDANEEDDIKDEYLELKKLTKALEFFKRNRFSEHATGYEFKPAI